MHPTPLACRFSGRIPDRKVRVLADIIFDGSLLGQTYVLERLWILLTLPTLVHSVFRLQLVLLVQKIDHVRLGVRFTRLAIAWWVAMRCQIVQSAVRTFLVRLFDLPGLRTSYNEISSDREDRNGIAVTEHTFSS
jgi:hypothetical protein